MKNYTSRQIFTWIYIRIGASFKYSNIRINLDLAKHVKIVFLEFTIQAIKKIRVK